MMPAGSSQSPFGMPAAVPGLGTPDASQPPAGMPMGGPSPLPGLLPPGGPAPSQYQAVTQEDGTVLLHIQNADGSLGPAVKIISPPKPGGGKAAGGPQM